jgi:hypothetical protein
MPLRKHLIFYFGFITACKKMASEKIRLNFCELSIKEQGIIQIVLFPGTVMGPLETKQIEESILKLNQNRPSACLVLIGDFVEFGMGARNYGASAEGAQIIKAAAYVVNNAGHHLVGNMFQRVDKPVRPVAVFYTETEAMEWLRNFNKNQPEE